MPQNDDKDPESGADAAKGRDVPKVQSAQSKGENFASYQGSHSIKASDDTHRSEPAVVVDESPEAAISDITALQNEARERARRSAATAVISLEGLPIRRKNTAPLLVFATLVVIAAVGLIVRASRGTADETGVTTATAVPGENATVNPPVLTQTSPIPSATQVPTPTTSSTAASSGSAHGRPASPKAAASQK